MELTDFYASLKNDKFPNIQQFAMKMLILFASTYICEQTFSCMNINKSKYHCYSSLISLLTFYFNSRLWKCV